MALEKQQRRLTKDEDVHWSAGDPFVAPGSTRTFGNLPFSSAVIANHFPSSEQKLQLRNFQQPVWQVVPVWETDDSPLGRAYIGFHRIGQRSSKTLVSQDLGLIDATLLFRKRRATDLFSADNWASELQSCFVEPVTYTIKLASVYVLACLMRWLLNPTQETYATVPALMRPTLQQRMRSHPASVDVVAMPAIRDALIDNMRDFLDAILQAGLDVSWPRSVNEALLVIRPKGANIRNTDEHVFISPEFAAHVGNPKNWILGRKILAHFPELATSDTTISGEDVVRGVDRWL